MTTRHTTPLEKSVMVYLNQLRESGETNMFGATPYIAAHFELDKNEAKRLLILWMSNFNDEGNYDTIKIKEATETAHGNSPIISSIFSNEKASDGIDKCIASLVGSRLDLIPIKEREANAKLMAAAPLLLKTLQDMYNVLGVADNIKDTTLRAWAIAAIKEATE